MSILRVKYVYFLQHLFVANFIQCVFVALLAWSYLVENSRFPDLREQVIEL